MRNKFLIYGWVDSEHDEFVGTFWTNYDLHDCWDYITQEFNPENKYAGGLYAKRAV